MTLIPDTLDLEIWKGATFRAELTLYTDDAGTELWDLSGYSATMEIKDKPGDTIPIYSLSTDDSTIELGDAEGTITLLVDSEETALLDWKRGVYDLLISAPGGDTDPILYGKVKVVGV